jgi:hypothetical protein
MTGLIVASPEQSSTVDRSRARTARDWLGWGVIRAHGVPIQTQAPNVLRKNPISDVGVDALVVNEVLSGNSEAGEIDGTVPVSGNNPRSHSAFPKCNRVSEPGRHFPVGRSLVKTVGRFLTSATHILRHSNAELRDHAIGRGAPGEL